MSFASPDPVAQFAEGEKRHRTKLSELREEAIKKEGKDVDLSAYAQAHDMQFLGVCGPNYMGKPFANDRYSVYVTCVCA